MFERLVVAQTLLWREVRIGIAIRLALYTEVGTRAASLAMDAHTPTTNA